MINNIRKYSFLSVFTLVLSFISTSIYAYTLKIKNDTDGQIYVQADYASGLGVCSDKTILIDPNTTGKISHGACCLNVDNGLTISATNGTLKGKTVTWNPDSTGANISCKGNSVTIKPSGGNLYAY